MEALTINIVLQLMDGIKISKTFIPTRYGLKILLPIYYSQNQVGLALAYRKKKWYSSHVIRQVWSDCLINYITRSSSSEQGPQSGKQERILDLAIYIVLVDMTIELGLSYGVNIIIFFSITTSVCYTMSWDGFPIYIPLVSHHLFLSYRCHTYLDFIVILLRSPPWGMMCQLQIHCVTKRALLSLDTKSLSTSLWVVMLWLMENCGQPTN